MPKTPENKRAYGAFGESVAADFLEKKGYTVLSRNFTVRGGELDIVATDGKYLCFVEVKTRKSRRGGAASEAVDRKKIEHMLTAAERYLYDNRENELLSALSVRFDVIEIYTHSATIRHIKGIDITQSV